MNQSGRKKSICLVITHRCNLRCKYCFVSDRSPKSMDFSMAQRIIKQAFNESPKSFDYLEVMLIGGEPLLEFPFIKTLVEWMPSVCNNKGYVIFAITNGTVLTAQMKDWFVANRQDVCLCLSYDGDVAQDLTRSMSKQKIDIDFFIRTWPRQPLKMTIDETMVSHLYENVLGLYRRGAILEANIPSGVPVWNEPSWNQYSIQLARLVHFFVNNSKIVPINLIMDFDLINLYKKDRRPQRCGAGESFYAVDVDGKKYPCHMFSPLAQDGGRELLYEDFKRIKRCSKDFCKGCLLDGRCPNCVGVNYKISGNMFKPDPNICRANRIQLLACCKYHAQRIQKQAELCNEDILIARTISKLAGANFNLKKGS